MATYAHIENGTITGIYDNLPDTWRNISNFFVLINDPDAFHSLGWRTIQKVTPVYNEYTQRLGFASHEIVDDEVIETISVIDLPVPPAPPVLTEEEIAMMHIEQHNVAMNELRTKRDLLLAQTDYTQLADIVAKNGTELTTLYVEYRQSLRDLPSLYENDMTFLSETDAVYPALPSIVVVTPPDEAGVI